MKSERRPGCACSSARASSFTLRQNAKRVDMACPGKLPEKSHRINAFACTVLGPWLSRPRGGEEGFSAALRWAARMATPAAAKWATDLADAIRSEDPDDARNAGLSAVDAKIGPLAITRHACRAYA